MLLFSYSYLESDCEHLQLNNVPKGSISIQYSDSKNTWWGRLVNINWHNSLKYFLRLKLQLVGSDITLAPEYANA